MSWHFEARFKRKDKAKEVVLATTYIPDNVRDAVCHMIDALPDTENTINVYTTGHIDAKMAHSEIKVSRPSTHEDHIA